MLQLTTLSGLDRSLTQSVLEGGCAEVMPSTDMVHRRAEPVTRAIQVRTSVNVDNVALSDNVANCDSTIVQLYRVRYADGSVWN